MSRACRCDISHEMANEIFTNHIPASMMADPVKLLWRYTSTSMKSCTPRWSEIRKWRHFLGDLLAATEGRRLRQKEWCRQVAERFKLNGLLLKSVDEISHQPHGISTSCYVEPAATSNDVSSLKVPSKFQMLTSLVNMVRLCVGEADGCDCGDASSDVSSTELLSLGWEGAQTCSRTSSTADASDVEQISCGDEPILILPTDAKRAELDMTEIVCQADNEGTCFDGRPDSSTLQSWPLSHAELATLVAEKVTGCSNAEYAAAKPKKAKIKPSPLKRSCAAVLSPLADVQKLAADGKPLPRHTVYKRIHSKAWHQMFDFFKLEGGATDVAKQEAGASARKATVLWRSLLAAESK